MTRSPLGLLATKRRLLEGGLLQEVELGVVVPQDPPDPRGRKVYAFSPLDALIEQRPSAGPGGTLDTDRADNTVLVIFDPAGNHRRTSFQVGRTDRTSTRLRRLTGSWQDEETGTRYASEVTVIR